MIENYTMGPIPLVYLYYTCNYHYDRKLHNGSNSTSLFILTLRESYKLSDSRGNTYLLLPSILGPPLPHTGARVMTKVMRNEVCLKIYGRLMAGIFIFIF